ncbi:MAG: hypothetical protein WBV92_05590 [Nitrosotalea sp.]
MITRSQRKMFSDTKEDFVLSTDGDNSKKKPTAQDYKKMLQKRLYELESESMPAT